MFKKNHKQQGMTTIGLIIIISIAGILLLTLFKVLPMYIEYYQVKSVIDSTAADQAIDVRSKRDLWESINKKLRINQIKSITPEDVTYVREDDSTTITVDYEVRKSYIAHLFIGGHFVYSAQTNR